MRFTPLVHFALAISLMACGDADQHTADAQVFSEGEPDSAAPDARATPLPDGSCKLESAQLNGPALQPFAADGELESYIAAVTSRCVPPPVPSTAGFGGDAGLVASSAPTSSNAGAAAPVPSDSASAGNETITNNQEVGVDEGDIVKNIGDSLLVLRKGRLFAVNVASSGAPGLTDSIRVAATDNLNSGVWYDELLVHNDLLYVIGYRYSVPLSGQGAGVSFTGPSGATEIDVFRLSAGKLARVGQTFIESWDYYSGTNYASRLVDGTLVFYMPISAKRGERLSSDGTRYVGLTGIPRVLSYNQASQQFDVVGPLFSASDVQRPLGPVASPVFHSIVRCKLASTGLLNCATKAVLGSYGRQFYVSPSRVYLWTTSHVFAMGLGDFTVSAHAINGLPSSQFAFKELDETLHVATAERNTLSMWKLPLSAFDTEGKQELAARKILLASHGASYASVAVERFAGSTYIASLEGNSYSSGATQIQRVFYDVSRSDPAFVESGTGSYQRIEPLGANRALLVGRGVGSRANSLELEVWTLAATPAHQSTLSVEGLAQGESRSHGFFYKPLAGDHGTFGLPVLGPEAGLSSSWYSRGLSNIGFFDVTTSHELTLLGAISSGANVSQCETSCIDWYGNTRPIFLRDRTFALMGSELREVTLRPMTAALGNAALLTF